MIFGLECDEPLPEGCVPLEAFVVIKALDEGGQPCLLVRHTPSCDEVLAIGMLTMALEQQKEAALSGWEYGDEE